MYKKLILIFLFFSLNLFAAKVLEIDKDFIKHDSSNYLYFIENNDALTIKDVLNSEDFKLPKKHHFTSTKSAFWTKISLKNTSNSTQVLSLSNILPGTNYVDVYVFKKNKEVILHHLGDLQAQNKREEISRFSMFNLSLDKNEEVTIISRIKNYYIYNLGWKIQQRNVYIYKELHFLLYFGIFAGMLILYSLYNFFVFNIKRSIPYLILSLNVFITLLYLSGVSGILYQMDLGLNLDLITAITWNSSIFLLIGLLLLPYYFFNIKNTYPKLKWYFRFKILLAASIIILLLYAQFFDESYFYVFRVVAFSAVFSCISLLITAIYMYYKKEKGSRYYLIGQGLYLICIIVYTLVMNGLVPYFLWFKMFFPLGIMLDLIFFSIALYDRTQIKHLEDLQNKEYLLEQSRFSTIGQTIAHVTHQWKHPLTQIGTSTTLIQTVLNHQKENVNTTLKEQLPLIQNNIHHMSKTLHELSNFYSSTLLNNDALIQECIQNSIKMIQSKITLKNVTINLIIKDKDIRINNHIFSNILLNLIDNSLDEFDSSFKKNTIDITSYKQENKIIILYEDNAGGIKINPISSIFEYNISTKKNIESFGMGMVIVRMLIEEKLFGSIKIKNHKEGVQFKIVL